MKWKPAPEKPGLYLFSSTYTDKTLVNVALNGTRLVQRLNSWSSVELPKGRWFGPIPEDSGK